MPKTHKYVFFSFVGKTRRYGTRGVERQAQPNLNPALVHGQTPTAMAPPHRDNIQPGWAHADATDDHFSHKQCTNKQCQIPSTNGQHDDGDARHSFERRGDHIVNGSPASRTRSATAHRSTANVVHAIDTDISGVIAPSGHKAYAVFVVGDVAESAIHIAYNTEIVEYGDVALPTSTPQALNGPQAKDWRAAYRKDLEAKIKKRHIHIGAPTTYESPQDQGCPRTET